MSKMIYWIILSVVACHASEEAEEVERLFHDFARWKVTVVAPELGLARGFTHWFDKPTLNNYTINFNSAMNSSCKAFGDRATKLLQDPQTSQADARFLRLLRFEVGQCVERLKFRGYLLAPISFMGGVQVKLPVLFGRTLKYANTSSEQNLDLLMSIPNQLSDIRKLLEQGVLEGVTHANESLYRAREQFKRLQVKNPTESDFYAPFRDIREGVPNIDDKKAKELQQRAKTVIRDNILPAFKHLQEYIFREYYTHLRPAPGVHSLPRGQEFYQERINYFTTLKGVQAQTIHNLGLEEVARLRQQAEKSAVKVGMGNLTFDQIADKLRRDQDNRFSSDAEALEFTQSKVNQANQKLKQLFSSKVLQDYVYQLAIEPIPGGRGGLAYYQPPSVDGSKPGTFFSSGNV